MMSQVKQAINGILLVNKPQGLSSNAVLQRVKHLFNAKKAGHTGSLDPLATGMLPICFGEATKFSQYLLDADKCYQAKGLLGIKTDTADALGEIIETKPFFSLNKTDLEKALERFKGKILQVPSMFSALKHKGKPLYQYARKGINIARDPREITIHQLELLAFDGKEFSIKVSCTKGTYIRNLVEDIGDFLGIGAHVTALHRLSTAGFANETMYSLADLENKTFNELQDFLLPVERVLHIFPILKLKAASVLTLRNGLTIEMQKEHNSVVRLYDEEGQFIGLGEFNSEGRLAVKRLLAFESAL